MRQNNNFEVDKDILRSNLDHHIGVFKYKVIRDRRKTTQVEVFKGTAAAFTTALLGIAQLEIFDGYTDFFQLLAITITALLAIVAAWDGLFRHKSLWVINIAARNRFFALREDFEHAEATGTLTQELLQELYLKYKDILRTTNEGWAAMRKEGAD